MVDNIQQEERGLARRDFLKMAGTSAANMISGIGGTTIFNLLRVSNTAAQEGERFVNYNNTAVLQLEKILRAKTEISVNSLNILTTPRSNMLGTIPSILMQWGDIISPVEGYSETSMRENIKKISIKVGDETFGMEINHELGEIFPMGDGIYPLNFGPGNLKLRHEVAANSINNEGLASGLLELAVEDEIFTHSMELEWNVDKETPVTLTSLQNQLMGYTVGALMQEIISSGEFQRLLVDENFGGPSTIVPGSDDDKYNQLVNIAEPYKTRLNQIYDLLGLKVVGEAQERRLENPATRINVEFTSSRAVDSDGTLSRQAHTAMTIIVSDKEGNSHEIKIQQNTDPEYAFRDRGSLSIQQISES